MDKEHEHSVVSFFKELYKECNTGSIKLKFKPSDANEFIRLSEVDSIPEILAAHNGEKVLFGIATRKKVARQKEEIHQIPSLWVSIADKGTFP